MKKRILLIIIVLIGAFTTVEAQQTYTYYNCEVSYRDVNGNGSLVDDSFVVESVELIFPPIGGIVLKINYGGPTVIGYMKPLMFVFIEGQRQPNGQILFTDVSQHDPESLQIINDGFMGVYGKSGNNDVIVLNKGTVTYLRVVLR